VLSSGACAQRTPLARRNREAVGVAYLPAAVAPAGIGADGLPVGIQIVGPYPHDRTVIAFAQVLADVIGGFTPPPAYTAATP
jgi:Asp-tRNA(Asn)/Glu-tRNA(Gln) amidotransferase A subunit family amidase